MKPKATNGSIDNQSITTPLYMTNNEPQISATSRQGIHKNAMEAKDFGRFKSDQDHYKKKKPAKLEEAIRTRVANW